MPEGPRGRESSAVLEGDHGAGGAGTGASLLSWGSSPPLSIPPAAPPRAFRYRWFRFPRQRRGWWTGGSSGVAGRERADTRTKLPWAAALERGPWAGRASAACAPRQPARGPDRSRGCGRARTAPCTCWDQPFPSAGKRVCPGPHRLCPPAGLVLPRRPMSHPRHALHLVPPLWHGWAMSCCSLSPLFPHPVAEAVGVQSHWCCSGLCCGCGVCLFWLSFFLSFQEALNVLVFLALFAT